MKRFTHPSMLFSGLFPGLLSGLFLGLFGVACGPTQVFSSVRARWGRAAAEHRFEVRAGERRNNLGFRCVFALER